MVTGAPEPFQEANVDRAVASGWRRLPTASVTLLPPLVGVVLLLGAWWLFAWLLQPPPYLLPQPRDVLQRIVEDRASLFENLIATLNVSVQGLALSLVIGVLIGVMMASWEWLRRLLMPAIIATQSIPKIALAPLLVVWLGLGVLPKLIVVILIVVFPIILATIVGIQSVTTEKLHLARSMGAGPMDVGRYILAPTAAPYIAAAFKLGASLALIGALFAEFVGGKEGIGIQMVFAIGLHDTELAFGALLVTSLAGIALYGCASVLANAVTSPVARND